MILAGAIIRGFKNEINAKIFGFWGHIHISDSNINRDFELRPINTSTAYFSKIKEIKYITTQVPESYFGFALEGKYKDQQSKGGIKSLHPYIVMPCLVETKKDMLAGLFKGVNEEYNWQEMKRFIIDGTTPNFQDSVNQILVSKIIAQKLNLKTGSKLIVTFIKNRAKLKRVFMVSGIYNTGLEEYDERFILGNSVLIQDILQWAKNDYSGIEVFVDDIDDIALINEYIYANVLPSDLYSETIQEKFPNIFEWLKLQDINEKIILLLMAIVALINLITVLLILILERTKMVGILKSIGASSWLIRKIFVYHASYIMILGMLIGNILGLGIAYIQKFTGFIKLDENNYYLDTAPIDINYMHVAEINVSAFIICFLTLLLPSILVAKIKPVDALKFD